MVSARGGFRYSLDYLINAVLLADLMRNSAELRDALEMAVRVCLPPGISHYYAACLKQNIIKVPRKATISHMRFVLDMALLSWQRRHYQESLCDKPLPPTVCMLTDSSPQ